MDFLFVLESVLQERKKNMPEGSYTARLFQEGEDRILKKIVEETGEVVIAAKNGVQHEIIHELADLWFHSLVLMVEKGISIADILKELEKRHKK